MKLKFFFPVLILMAGNCVYAEEANVVSDSLQADIVAINTVRTANVGRIGEAADHNESCSCSCSAQGILLRECEGETENLGNYGNIENCNNHMKSHPKCS